MIRRSARSSASARTSRPIHTRLIGASACLYSTWSRWCIGFIVRSGHRVSNKISANRNRLDRSLRPQAADGFERQVKRVARQLRGGETAETALASAHAAAGDGFEAIDLRRAEVLAQRLAQYASRDVFAPAYRHLIRKR